METLLSDLRFGIRMLFKNPVFTAVCVIALALGIGANTAIFSVVNAILLRPLPFKDADRLVMVWEHSYKTGNDRNVASPADFLDWRAQNQVFELMGAGVDYPGLKVNLTGFGEPQDLQMQLATADLFNVLGTNAEIGRTFTSEESAPNGPTAVVISHRMWQSIFNGDRAIIGKSIRLSDTDYTVVGVMPPSFQFGQTKPDLWLPLNINPAINYRQRSGRYLIVAARLKPGVTASQAQAQMTTIAKNLEQQYPQFNSKWGVNIVSLYEQIVGNVRPALLLLLGTVLLVLLIACANVANLLLARSTVRQKEIAVRTAMGASRWRIIRQLLTESIVLSFIGGIAGLLLAMWGIKVLVSLSPDNIPRLQNVGIEPRVLLFTLGVSLLTGVIFGLAPALENSRSNINETLRDGGRGTTGSRRSRVIRGSFVVIETAVALILLICSGLMIKSFVNLQSTKSGINPENVLTMRISLPQSRYGSNDRLVEFFRDMDQRLESIPGVESAGAISFLPFAGSGSATGFTIVGRPEPAAGDQPVTGVSVIESHYFRAMGIPLIKGRELSANDAGDASRVLLINETLARKYFANEDPIGKRLVISWDRREGSEEIVGVVGDVHETDLSTEVKPMIYWPSPRTPYNTMSIAIRTNGNPMNFVSAVKAKVHEKDADLPLADLKPMEDWLTNSVARARFNTQLLTIFAAVALILAGVGIYGVMAYSVTQRTQELGIRMALGAQQGEAIKLVIGQAMTLAVTGVVIGLVVAFGLGKLLTSFSSLLFNVKATDPLTYIQMAVTLLVIALLASFFPARRATKVDPMIALRSE